MPADEKLEIISYLEKYHGFLGSDLKMNDLFDYLPQVFEKICSNIKCYVEEEGGLLLHPLSSNA